MVWVLWKIGEIRQAHIHPRGPGTVLDSLRSQHLPLQDDSQIPCALNKTQRFPVLSARALSWIDWDQVSWIRWSPLEDTGLSDTEFLDVLVGTREVLGGFPVVEMVRLGTL